MHGKLWGDEDESARANGGLEVPPCMERGRCRGLVHRQVLGLIVVTDDGSLLRRLKTSRRPTRLLPQAQLDEIDVDVGRGQVTGVSPSLASSEQQRWSTPRPRRVAPAPAERRNQQRDDDAGGRWL